MVRDPPILEVPVSACSGTHYDMDTGYGKQGLGVMESGGQNEALHYL